MRSSIPVSSLSVIIGYTTTTFKQRMTSQAFKVVYLHTFYGPSKRALKGQQDLDNFWVISVFRQRGHNISKGNFFFIVGVSHTQQLKERRNMVPENNHIVRVSQSCDEEYWVVKLDHLKKSSTLDQQNICLETRVVIAPSDNK